MDCCAIALAAFLAGGIASLAGFGISSLLTPLLAYQYGMKMAVSAVAIPHLIATVLRFWRLRRDVDRPILWSFGVVNAIGSLAGALVHLIILGVLLVFAGAVGVLGYADRMRFGRGTAWLAGGLSGAFGGLVGNQGGIRSAAMLGLGVQGPAFAATATAIGLMVDAVRMLVYFITEHERMFSARPAVVAATAGVVAGTLVGERLLRKIPERVFRRTVSAILVAVGVYLLVASPR